MRHIAFLLFAAVSLHGVAIGASRPRYGGTARIMMQAAPNSLELPLPGVPSEYWASERILRMISDNLVTLDLVGQAHPALAIAWQSELNGKRWQFTLRHDVKFHDGSIANAAAIEQILTHQHSDWTIRVSGDTLTIESGSPLPAMLAELAQTRNAILKRSASGLTIGTGPFRLVDFQPGKFLKLAANEESWAGRPFADNVEVEFGKSLRDQALALELGKVDLVEAMAVSPSNGSPLRGQNSLPVELMALVIPATSKAQDVRQRESLALVIDRKPIQSILLKGAGEPTASILPDWMTGYSAIFPAKADVQRARVVLANSRQPALVLSYDARDPQAQLIAERIALNAREAGITLQVSISGVPDVSLVRIVLPSSDPATSLREAAQALGQPQPMIHGNSLEDIFAAERALLDSHTVIPLIHLPVASAAGSRVRHWRPSRAGEWNMPDMWLEADSR